jgi:carboxyl-terminal processing protease
MKRLISFALFAISACAQRPPTQHQLDIDSFERVWTTIRDRHWEKKPGGLDWQAIHDEFRPRIERAQSIDEVRALLREMLGRLHQTHFGILPGDVYNALGPAGDAAAGDGSPGIDLRILDGQAVVTRVDPGSPAERAGVKPGWIVLSVNSLPFAPAIEELASDSTLIELTRTRALLARLNGPVGGKTKASFLDGAEATVSLELSLAEPRGQSSSFGNLPPMHVWFESKTFESKTIGSTGYIAFSEFLDLPRVMTSFGAAVTACKACTGLVIDLRGNPGGIGGMALGMAGYLVEKPDQRLGAMYTRDTTLNFTINPRLPTFQGPVAILLDACSASTSEIFAGGLKDLGRARVFGTRSAAAALPSTIERLPNGDGFQFAIANYISEGGQPLEGIGVPPDEEVKLTREALLAGRDPVIEAALSWIARSAAAPRP